MRGKMEVSDKQFAELVHMHIHALRLSPNYKPSSGDLWLSELVIKKFLDTCEECKQRGIAIANMPKKEGVFKKIGRIINEQEQ
jgi:hypothetical protein